MNEQENQNKKNIFTRRGKKKILIIKIKIIYQVK